MLPVIAVGLWAFVAVVAGSVYPAFIQRFQVQPAESTKERPYIARNIAATRDALGVDKVNTQDFKLTQDVTSADLATDDPTLTNIRLRDPNIVSPTFQRVQGIRSFYQFNDLDVDRYMIDGQEQPGRAGGPRAATRPISRRTRGRAGTSPTPTATALAAASANTVTATAGPTSS